MSESWLSGPLDPRIQLPASAFRKPGITNFLLARVSEDEARAKYVSEYGDTGGIFPPARVLFECAAKRAIVEQHEAYVRNTAGSVGISWVGARCGQEATAGAMKALAAVYKDHPDYRQEWAL